MLDGGRPAVMEVRMTKAVPGDARDGRIDGWMARAADGRWTDGGVDVAVWRNGISSDVRSESLWGTAFGRGEMGGQHREDAFYFRWSYNILRVLINQSINQVYYISSILQARFHN